MAISASANKYAYFHPRFDKSIPQSAAICQTMRFRGSVHNVMEPAAMAKAVLFGPTIQNAYEASLLVERGGAKLVHDAQQLADAITLWLNDRNARDTAGSIGKRLIEENLGAVERTLEYLREYV